jgi:hypothetical protein
MEDVKNNDKSLKTRVANIMQYEEFLSEEKIKSVLSSYKLIKKYAYIRHDKDKVIVPDWQVDDLRNCDNAINPAENKEVKKPHFHIVLQLSQAISINSIAKWFGIKPNYIECPKGTKAFIQCVEYLTHESKKQQDAGKYKYDDCDVFANFDFRQELEIYQSKRILQDATKPKILLREKVLEGLPLSQLKKSQYLEDMAALNYCRKEYLRLHAPLPASRTNYYIRGGSGAGKSLSSRALAKSIIDPTNIMRDDEVYFVAGQGASKFQGYDGQPVIIYDDLRAWDLLDYYKKSPGAIFNLFDVVPSSSEQNIKFGSIKLINSINIVNSIDEFEKFSSDICFRVAETGIKEPDKQMYRRFPLFINISEDSYDLFVNKQFFNPDEPNYKAYMQYRNLGIKAGLINAVNTYGENNPKFLELRNKHFEQPITEHKKVVSKFKQKDFTEIELEQQYLFDMEQLENKKIDVVDFEIETLSEEMQKQKRIEELKAELRKLTAFSF